MEIVNTSLPGVHLLKLERYADERGSFARSFCIDELADAGISFAVDQASISVNRLAGTVRGMHWQKQPAGEVKIVRCVRGAIFDVAVDMRPDSETYCQWFGARLDAARGDALFIPQGFAHGFQSLEDDSEVHYLMQGKYEPEAATGARFDDSVFGIDWPLPVSSISDKDRQWPSISDSPSGDAA